MTQHQMAEEEEEEEEECVLQQQEARQRGRVGITSMNILQFHESVMCPAHVCHPTARHASL